jgi:DNA-binding CsgD family transcriptional regulator
MELKSSYANRKNRVSPADLQVRKKSFQKPIAIGAAIAIFFVFCFVPGRQKYETFVRQGIADISSVRDGIVPLSGEWVCLEDSGGNSLRDAFARLPSYWDHPVGFASYRMKAVGLDPHVKYALWVPAVETSFRVLGDGKVVFAAGHPERTETRTRPAYLSGVASLPSGISEIELVLEVANYGHRQGGPRDVVKLGDMEDILRYDSWNVAGDSAVVIMFLVMGGIYGFNSWVRRKSSLLFVGLIYFFGALDVFLSSPQFLVYRFFPLLDFGFYKKAQYIVSFLRAPWLVLAAWSLFGSVSFRAISLAVGPFFLGMLFIVPYTVFTRTCSFFQIYSVVLVIGTLAICLRGARRGYPFSRIIALAFLLMAGMALSEIMYMNNKIQGGQYLPFAFVSALCNLDYVSRTILDIFSCVSMIILVNALSLVFMFEERKLSAKSIASIPATAFPDESGAERIRAKCEESNLSPRETEVAILALRGKSNIQIGEELFISVSTVKTHFSKIFQKTGTKTRGELFAYFWS